MMRIMTASLAAAVLLISAPAFAGGGGEGCSWGNNMKFTQTDADEGATTVDGTKTLIEVVDADAKPAEVTPTAE